MLAENTMAYTELVVRLRKLGFDDTTKYLEISDEIFKNLENERKIKKRGIESVVNEVLKQDKNKEFFSLLLISFNMMEEVFRKAFKDKKIPNVTVEEILIMRGINEIIDRYKKGDKEIIKKYFQYGEIYNLKLKNDLNLSVMTLMLRDLFEAVKDITKEQQKIEFPVKDVRNFGRLFPEERKEVFKNSGYSITRRRINKGSEITIKYLEKSS